MNEGKVKGSWWETNITKPKKSEWVELCLFLVLTVNSVYDGAGGMG